MRIRGVERSTKRSYPRQVRPLAQTQRLLLYPLQWADLPDLEIIYSDPEVMRYLSEDGQPWPPAVLHKRLEDWINDQQTLGYSKWKVCLRSTGETIGRAGFGIFAETGETELGYSFVGDKGTPPKLLPKRCIGFLNTPT